jgi:DNA polymerase IV
VIACVLIPHFAAAVECQADPSLATVPLVIAGWPQSPDKVLATCQEAARLGVKPGLSLRQARALCPQARLIPAQSAQYQPAYDKLLDIFARFSPRFEIEEVDLGATGYLDLANPAKAELVALARLLGRAVRLETGLAPGIGLARGKFPARVAAAKVGTNKVLHVPPGREAAFLALQPVDLLPLDQDFARRLCLLGLRTLGHLAALPTGAFLTQFGSDRRWLHELARGRDPRPVRPHRPSAVERATRPLDGPVLDRTMLGSLLQTLAADLAHRLQAAGQMSRQVWLHLHLENDSTWETRYTLRQPTANPNRLALTLDLLLGQAQVQCGVVALTATAADLVPASGQQLDLFAHPGQVEQARRLSDLMPGLVARYGPDSFYRAAVTNPAAPLPEHRFHLRGVDSL